MSDEPFRLTVEITGESAQEALLEAMRLAAAAYGGPETYKSMASELATNAFAALDLDGVSDGDLQILANRIGHLGYGLTVVAVQALHRTGRDIRDVLNEIEEEHGEAWL
jgi:hypothetical protein